MKEQLKKADLYGLAIIAATLIVYSTRSVWTIYQTLAVVVGALLVVVSVALKLPEIRTGLGRRSSRYGINSATTVVLVLGILVFVNYLGAQHFKRVDFTSGRIFSLSDQSVQVAGQVKEDVHIKAYYAGGEYPQARELLGLYSNQNRKISFEFIDPDKKPELAQQDQVTVYEAFRNPLTGEVSRSETLVLSMGSKKQRIEKQNTDVKEEDITNALLKLVKGTQKTVYFTTGHGERDFTAQQPKGYLAAKTSLEKENYVVKPVNLIQEEKVPMDAAVVVVAGPTTEPLAAELDALDTYLNGGGSVMLLLDPSPSASMKELLKKWSIDPDDDVVVDISGANRLSGAGPTNPLVQRYEGHRITQGFNVMTFFPLTRSISPAKPPVAGISVEPLLRTSAESWGESDLKPGGKEQKVGFDEKKDIKGPVTIAAVATKTSGEKKGRLVVFGDSDFALNQYFDQAGNGNLFTNSVTYLAQDENFISIKAKDPANRPVTMTESQQKSVAWLVQVLLPGAVMVAGISVWMKRRK